ncbi:MAG: right-handed parallel beta-helix repeat-containing protein [Actinomycetota bacterium]
MLRGVTAAAAFAVVLLSSPLAAQTDPRIAAFDDAFEPPNPVIEIGTVVTFSNEGDNAHTVTADDGSFDSGDLKPGTSFFLTADEPGRIPYYCRYHGAPGGFGMSGTLLVGSAQAVEPEEEPLPPPTEPGGIIRVRGDHPSIQAAVDAASPGDLILVEPGVYREAVRVTTPYLTIRGTDRNEVILDGGFELSNGIHVLDAPGVAVENMTARNYLLNGFYWIGVQGYRGSYLTAYNNGDYGVYAFDSVHGQLDHSYASGHPDSGFYIGQCDPCHALVTDVLAENNALGWSGTNASGDLIIASSEWRNNMAGIVPNTLDSELLPPQHGQTIVGNWVHDNSNRDAPAKPGTYSAFGVGIVVAGGNDNVVARNRVEDHKNYGIAVLPNLDRNLWIAGGNRVEDNAVFGSGIADLAMGAPADPGNCFEGNEFGSSLPPAIEVAAGCGFAIGGGDGSVTLELLGRVAEAEAEDFPRGDWRTQPEPPLQPQMPGAATAPPAPALVHRTPERIDLEAVPVPLGDGSEPNVNREVTVMGLSLTASSFWTLLIGVYGYTLPLILYASWVSIAMWDLVRRDDLGTARRVAWMAGILLIPLLGPVAYYVLGRSPIAPALRTMLVAGGLLVYGVVAAVAYSIAAS